jgi:hypothetical protein
LRIVFTRKRSSSAAHNTTSSSSSTAVDYALSDMSSKQSEHVPRSTAVPASRITHTVYQPGRMLLTAQQEHAAALARAVELPQRLRASQ